MSHFYVVSVSVQQVVSHMSWKSLFHKIIQREYYFTHNINLTENNSESNVIDVCSSIMRGDYIFVSEEFLRCMWWFSTYSVYLFLQTISSWLDDQVYYDKHEIDRRQS